MSLEGTHFNHVQATVSVTVPDLFSVVRATEKGLPATKLRAGFRIKANSKTEDGKAHLAME